MAEFCCFLCLPADCCGQRSRLALGSSLQAYEPWTRSCWIWGQLEVMTFGVLSVAKTLSPASGVVSAHLKTFIRQNLQYATSSCQKIGLKCFPGLNRPCAQLELLWECHHLGSQLSTAHKHSVCLGPQFPQALHHFCHLSACGPSNRSGKAGASAYSGSTLFWNYKWLSILVANGFSSEKLMVFLLHCTATLGALRLWGGFFSLLVSSLGPPWKE